MTIGIALFAPWGIAEAGDWSALPLAFAALAGKLALAGAGLALIETLLAKLRLFLAPEFLSERISARGARHAHALPGPGLSEMPLLAQFVNLLAAFLLLLAFAMLSQRRVLTLIKLFAWQGAALALSTGIVAWSTGQTHLYWSAVLTVLLKVILIPWVLHRLIDRLYVRWDIETLINIPTTMLIGIGLVIFAFALATPISQMASTLTRSTLGIALASVLLSFLMMIVRRKAVPQVIGFLAMENGLFFAATSATYGMPLVVELGVALDVLVGTFIFGIFFFHIREQFDSLDIRHMEKLKED